MTRIRPRAAGLRTVTLWSIPGNLRSSTYFARPVTFSRPSLRGTDFPMTRVAIELASVLGFIRFRFPNAKCFERFLSHHRNHRYLPLRVRPRNFLIDQRIIEPSFGGVRRSIRKIDTRGTSPIDSAQAHRAGLASRINLATLQ